jgi:hypothetical protein
MSTKKKQAKRAPAIFATAICLCMLFAACSPDDPGVNPTPQTAATPTATPASGQVADNTEIILATATTGAKVYYTQNGTEPNTTSTLYSDSNKPVITTGKLILKAIAVKDGMNNSATLTAVYTIVENIPPVASAGSNQNVTLASDLTVTLNGTASSDPDGSIASYAWECTEYAKHADVVTAYAPSQVTGMLNNANKATATVALRKAGTYTFKLTVTDNEGATGTQSVTVVVNPYTATLNNVGVDFPAFTAGSTTLSFAPTYTVPSDDWKEFSDSDITYILTDNKENSWTTGYIVDVTTATGYNQPDTITFTQTFSGTVTASKSLRAMIPPTGPKRFLSIQDMEGGSLTSIPAVTLNLSKTVSEVD